MKQKILLTIVICSFFVSAIAQKNKKVTAYAITGVQKGQNNWSEVRLVDITTGEEVKTIYQSTDNIEILNARTGKAIVKKDKEKPTLPSDGLNNLVIKKELMSLSELDPTGSVRIVPKSTDEKVIKHKILMATRSISHDKPFATNSAACAYDKKHERLYYTPMGINQLRYIDLKSKTAKIYYFEDEPFGVLKSSRDVSKQITRMVIASDGNGYALTNDAKHLIQFTTGKKPVITDLGIINDDPSNTNSIHSSGGYGGDMVADAQKNLYLITANRNVFKISLENRVATYQGAIKGLPKGFTTNGAIVSGGSMIIVSSSNSTQGYYSFDLTTLQSEKVSADGTFYNASDLANGTLAFEKKKKERKQELPNDVIPQAVDVVSTSPDGNINRAKGNTMNEQAAISVYPNPVINGVVKLLFDNQPPGKYQVQFIDISGKIISSREVTINNKVQVQEFRLPRLITAGNYLVKIVNDANRISVVNKLVVAQ